MFACLHECYFFWVLTILSHTTTTHTDTDSHTNIPLTLGYLTMLRCYQASLHQRCYGNVPASRATISGVTGATATQVVKVTDVKATLFHHCDCIVHGTISALWRQQKQQPLSPAFVTRMCDFACVSLCVWNLTCVALAGSRDQSVRFACCVDVTSIQGDGISLVVLHNYQKEGHRLRCQNSLSHMCW